MKTLSFDGLTPAQKQGILSQLVVPRPIAMISTVGRDGTVNVAPYSYYMPLTGEPPMIAVTMGTRRAESEGVKDTWRNLQDGDGEFVVNLTTNDLAQHIEAVAREYPQDISELDVAGWRTMPSRVVAAPSLADSPAHMECRVREVVTRGLLDVPGAGVHIVLAEVVCVTVEEELLGPDGRIDPMKVRAVGRMGFPCFVQAGPESVFRQERISYATIAATS